MTPTRRHVIAISLATLGAAGAPAIAADDQDRAEWLALWRTVVEAEERHDTEATRENEDELYLALSDAKDVIVDRPATSLVGLAVKLACAVRFTDMAHSLDADLDDFQEVELVAVYRDAVRLAGLPEDLWSGGQP